MILQVLQEDTKKKGCYRPLFNALSLNLKKQSVWKSVEVHAIYELFYTLCISKEGLQEIVDYLSAKDQDVFEPLFIAQYLLCPVNTIVKSYLLPMMKVHTNSYIKQGIDGERAQARKGKSEVYL